MSTNYAVVNMYGRQFRVKEGEKVQASFIAGEVGTKVTFSEVMMLNNNGKSVIGAPLVSGAKVTATIQSQIRAEKILVFKYLRKNKLKKTRGHRQPYTVFTIDKIEG